MLIAGLILFILLVLVHEFGHFIVAKRNGVDVEEFGFGFPPKIFGRTMGKGVWRTHYSFNLLPLGGFVRLKGENEADKRKGSFGAASFRTKTKIILAGVGMNYLVAVLLMSVVAAIRLPVLFDGQFTVPSDTTVLRQDVLVAHVRDGSPAHQAGLQVNDRILTLAGQNTDSGKQLATLTKQHAGQTIELKYSRAGQTSNVDVTLAQTPEDGASYLGVSPADITERRSSWSAPLVGFVVTNQLAVETLKLVGQALAALVTGHGGQAAEGLTGPVGVVAVLNQISSLPQLLLVTAAISLSLAIMNVLPIPALDGGRLFLSGLFKILRRPLSAKIENAVHSTGFILLIILVVLISIRDVQRFF